MPKLNCIIGFVLSGYTDVMQIATAVGAVIDRVADLGWIEVAVSLAAEGASKWAIAGLIMSSLSELGVGLATTVAL